MKHKFKQCDCENPDCTICMGLTEICIVCKGEDEELPTGCPGKEMTAEQKRRVCEGSLNFIYGKWESYCE